MKLDDFLIQLVKYCTEMVRTLTPEKNFPEECEGSEEIEPLLSDDLIEYPIMSSISSSISSSINNSIENSASSSMSNSIGNSIGMEFILIPAGEFSVC